MKIYWTLDGITLKWVSPGTSKVQLNALSVILFTLRDN